MQNCKLPESQEKQNLIQYLQAKIEKCENGVYASSGSQMGSREEEVWEAKLSVYREILNMIR